MTKQISNHAAAAKMIRQELKKHGIKGRVRARSYAGGSSVDVYIENQLPATAEQIKEFTRQFQYGHFDGMTDSYVYSNGREDLPQVSYASVQNSFSSEMKTEAWGFIREGFAGGSDLPEEYEEAHNKFLQGNRVSEMVMHLLHGDMGEVSREFWINKKERVRA